MLFIHNVSSFPTHLFLARFWEWELCDSPGKQPFLHDLNAEVYHIRKWAVLYQTIPISDNPASYVGNAKCSVLKFDYTFLAAILPLFVADYL